MGVFRLYLGLKSYDCTSYSIYVLYRSGCINIYSMGTMFPYAPRYLEYFTRYGSCTMACTMCAVSVSYSLFSPVWKRVCNSCQLYG